MIAHAYDNVPFYRAHYDAHGFDPRGFVKLEHIAQVPLLEKRDLRETPVDQLVARGVEPARCNVVSTSGSTGAPLRMYLDAAGQRHQRVSAWRIQFEHGYQWTWRTVEIRMTIGATHPLQRVGIAPKTWLSILDAPERWIDAIRAVRPEVILAGASTLHALASVWPDGMPRPRIIISDGETLYPATRALIVSRMGVAPVDVYGLVELSDFAWECERHDGYHWNADSHYVEIVDGTIVATDMLQGGMPVIRYRTGDRAEALAGECGCGRTLPRLGRIDGREADAVVLPSGLLLFWPFFHEVLAGHADLRRWRVRQRADQSLMLELETSAAAAQRIVADLAARLPERLRVKGEAVEAIVQRPGDKYRAVIREQAPC
jgi:phenylacetate-CoA ligase